MSTYSVEIHRYSLIPVSAPNSRSTANVRHGCLLRFGFNSQSRTQEHVSPEVGYADCFPWPELGDEPLEKQLDSLRTGLLTPITERSLFFAWHDAVARSAGVSLFKDLEIPPSHFLVTDLAGLNESTIHSQSKLGFRLFKLKVGKNPKTEASIIRRFTSDFESEKMKLRLDFNSSLNPETLNQFLDDLGEAAGLIDFLEDPIPFDPRAWASLERDWKIRLALDRINPSKLEQTLRQIPGSGVSVIVIKPASQDPTPLINAAKKNAASLVFTSSMDHPLGQLCAAWCAGMAATQGTRMIEPGGLLSQSSYLDHPWHDAIQSAGPHLIIPSGPGFGLDHRLEKLRWERV